MSWITTAENELALMPAFVSFDEFTDLANHGTGMLVFALTAECDDAARQFGADLQREVGQSAAVHLMWTGEGTVPTLVFYVGGDARPILTRDYRGAGSIAADLAEAEYLMTRRPSLAELAHGEREAADQTERMLASERLDHFPPFFQMARSLARDAWRTARATAQGAPLLLTSDAAAQRLAVCTTCPSLRDERCVECGCFVMVKAHLAAMRCPLEKWPTDLG
jgi:hypothetical protein